HVAHQDGHLAFFAAEHKLLRRLRELLDKGGSKILAEGVADLAALCLHAVISVEGDDCSYASQHQGWVGGIDKDAPIFEYGPPTHQDKRDCEKTNGCGGLG